MSEMYVCDFEVKGITLGAYVDSTGRFYCNVNAPIKNKHAMERVKPELGDSEPGAVEAKSLEELKAKALRRMNRAKIEIECWLWASKTGYYNSPDVLKHGFVTGRHSANRNLLVKWDGEKGRDQHGSWSRHLLKLAPGEDKVYIQLQKDLKAAQEAIEKFETKHRLDADKIIDELLGAERE